MSRAKVDEFKAKLLSQVVEGEHDWRVTEDRYRTVAMGDNPLTTHCPISAATGDTTHYSFPTDSGVYWLGLERWEARVIARAADNDGYNRFSMEPSPAWNALPERSRPRFKLYKEMEEFLDTLVELSKLPKEARVESSKKEPTKPIHALAIQAGVF